MALWRASIWRKMTSAFRGMRALLKDFHVDLRIHFLNCTYIYHIHNSSSFVFSSWSHQIWSAKSIYKTEDVLCPTHCRGSSNGFRTNVNLKRHLYCHQQATSLLQSRCGVGKKLAKCHQVSKIIRKYFIKDLSYTILAELIKGQLISKCPFGVIVWTNIQTKNLTNFCPRIA